jgi:hypothetical protein
MKPDKALVQAIAVTAELTGTDLTQCAAEMIAEDLARYPAAQVLGALRRCRLELRGRLTVAEVLARLDDGRPGPEEAWAMVPKDEAVSVVWSDEMRIAFGVAGPLMEEDPVAARMAFKEAYITAVQKARDEGTSVRWEPSLGHDPNGREAVLIQAAQLGRLTTEHALSLLPPGREDSQQAKALIDATVRKLLS